MHSPKYYHNNPIFGTDLNRPISTIVEGLRGDAEKIRSVLCDIKNAYPSWGERLECVEGLMTCALITLYSINRDIKEFENGK